MPTGGDQSLQIHVKQLDPSLPLPRYALPDDAGADLLCAADVELAPGQRVRVGTGIAVAIPSGYAGFVHPRSGLADRSGIGIVNAPGTIDAGYRGELTVLLINHDQDRPVRLRRGDRIAQLVIQRVERVNFTVVERLSDSVRGSGGYGSTGGWLPAPAEDRANAAGASIDTEGTAGPESAQREG